MKKIMKNVLVVFVVFFSVFGLTAFGKGMGHMFMDDDKIPDWAKDGVEDMYKGGVVEGFSSGDDKEFKGDEPVTRNQMAVMMSRYDKKVRMSAFVGLIHSLDKLGYVDVKDDYSAAAIMAEAGMMKLKAKPNPSADAGNKNKDKKGDDDSEDSGSVDLTVTEELQSTSLPAGYTYMNTDIQTFYLHFVGDRFVGQDNVATDQWYGPFNYGMLVVDPT